MLRMTRALAIGAISGIAGWTATALSIASAQAGELSYESRGYGGPLYIGPNFQQGGQYSPPSYGSDSGSKSYSRSYDSSGDERSSRQVSKKKRAKDEDVAEKKRAKPAPDGAASETVEKAEAASTPVTKKAENQNSSIASGAASARTDTAVVSGAPKETSAPAASPSPNGEGCRRFVASVGRVIDVPCD